MVGRSSAEPEAVEDLAVDELPTGTTLMNGAYTIENFLNAGGFGMTYVARDSLNRRVVIKECFPGAFCRRKDNDVQPRSRGHQAELNSVVRLFVNEAKALAKLDHPGVVGVHQVFEENNTAYMALDFVDGRDLLDVLVDPDLKLDNADVEAILRKLLDAIGFVHNEGILHRDISPDNILLDDELNPVLIDFGAAREQATKKTRVMSALRVVKDGYSPQEFYIGGSEQGPFSDLYSVGACFYHLLTDEIPPDGQVRIAALANGDEDPYRPLVGRVDGFSEDFLKAIDKSLAVLPKDRVRSAAQWLQMMDGETITPQRVTQLEIKRADGEDAGQNAPAADQPSTDAAPKAETVMPTENAEAPARETPVPVTEAKKTPALAKALASVVAIGVIGAAVATQTDLFAGPDEPASGPETTAELQPAAPAPILIEEPAPAPVEPVDAVVVEEQDPVEVEVEVAVTEDAGDTLDLNVVDVGSAVAAPTVAADPETGLIAPSWTVTLPFGMSFEPNRERVLSVNGVPVETREDFDAAIQSTVEPGDATTVALSIEVGTAESDGVTRDVDVPVVHRSGFANGLQFETRHDGSLWQTRVSALPANNTLEIAVNDQILALLNTNEMVDGIDTLPTLLQRELTSEASTLMFAVQRDGENWAVAVPAETLLAGAGG